ncbi:folate-binding protein [Fulvimonas sp. R45]|uniref:CAF17-like 4Fe-4S cluster assembly/insertion protein YgfZ n=1 Tax=Fulvimonas sp. R45 TaxID=3045937 RepID=UPI00265FC236|nr:folate-binding protein [Fulvimonas sp. R45]MDO1527428.1 folate-binding protein [Fulvimonas sp. R45]
MHSTAETLAIEGPDALAFAQSQFSNNVATLADGRWQFGAWLDAQGRVRSLFHLARLDGQRLLLLLRGGKASTLVEELRRYVFRSRVTLSAHATHSISHGEALPMFVVQCVDGTIALGCGGHSMRIIDDAGSDDGWRLPQVREGWPWLPVDASTAWLPPALSLYRLHAAALDKGCYPGQEIVARLHYRGGHKRHLHRVALSRVMPDGTTLHVDGNEAAQLLQTAHDNEAGIEALAVLGDDFAARVAHASGIDTDEGAQLRILAGWPD